MVLMGLFTLKGLSIEQYPFLAPPSIRVTATYPGASAVANASCGTPNCMPLTVAPTNTRRSTSLARAVDVPIPVHVYLNSPESKTKFISKGIFALPNASTDSPMSEGAQIELSQGATSQTISLPAANWSALGNPPGSGT